MSEEARRKMFPDDDPRTWNNGHWPPLALRKRWQDLHAAALTGVLTSDRTIGFAIREAAYAADWALRMEVERGIGP